MSKMIKAGLIFVLILGFTFSTTQFLMAGDKDSKVQEMIKQLKDENPKKRAEAAQKLGDSKSNEAVQPLVEVLKQDSDQRVRIVAATSLLKLGDKNLIPSLESIKDQEGNETLKSVLAGVINKLQAQDVAATK